MRIWIRTYIWELDADLRIRGTDVCDVENGHEFGDGTSIRGRSESYICASIQT